MTRQVATPYIRRPTHHSQPLFCLPPPKLTYFRLGDDGGEGKEWVLTSTGNLSEKCVTRRTTRNLLYTSSSTRTLTRRRTPDSGYGRRRVTVSRWRTTDTERTGSGRTG